VRTFSFAKAHRIRKRKDFVRISVSGKKVSDRHFVVLFAAAPAGDSRLGITVSRKVGGAVTRNRIKRRVREFFRHHRHRMPRPMDLNVIARKEAASLSSPETLRALERLFSRIDG
jgi:ribonuclease P protein component